jgi:hypothetical protein
MVIRMLCLLGTNPLAYLTSSSVTEKKSLMTLGPGYSKMASWRRTSQCSTGIEKNGYAVRHSLRQRCRHFVATVFCVNKGRHQSVHVGCRYSPFRVLNLIAILLIKGATSPFIFRDITPTVRRFMNNILLST